MTKILPKPKKMTKIPPKQKKNDRNTPKTHKNDQNTPKTQQMTKISQNLKITKISPKSKTKT